ncbi:MAG TPA: type II secretion system protein [Candidatus Omnitrophica bacterium]|nr:type II secretion system protein [Candidatus Omnitrophota bacterium]
MRKSTSFSPVIPEKGFSYVECLIAIFIVTLAFVAMMVAFNTATVMAKRAKNLIVATSLLREGIEEVKNLGYDNLSPGTTETIVEGIPPQTRRTITVEIIDDSDDGVSGDTDYKKVTVSIAWFEENEENNVSISTYISDHE